MAANDELPALVPETQNPPQNGLRKAAGWVAKTLISLLGLGVDLVTFGSQLILECAKDILPEPVSWLWPRCIPLGKLTVFAGDPGLGKSAVSLDVVACVTANRKFPDGTLPHSGEAIILSAEDDPADTLRPRLDAAGADIERVHILRAVRTVDPLGQATERGFNLTTDLSRLREALRSLPGVRLIVIDPLSAYLGNTDTHRTAAMRGVLAPVAKLASDYNVAILGIDHLNKSEKKPIYRVSGSIATVAAARVAWVFAKDKDDDSRRLMLPIKNNLSEDQQGFAYRIAGAEVPSEKHGPIPTLRVAWEQEHVKMNVDEVLSEMAQKDDSALAEAVDWVTATLTEPKPSVDLEVQAEQDGLSWSTVKRAKQELHLKPYKEGSHWMWPAVKNTKSRE
jgi:archaellum biogenesis ATPase FlaH